MNKFLLALLSGLLLAFSWPSSGIFPLIFIGFVPLFIIETEAENGKQIFCFSFFAFFLFNLITTYWIYNATIFGVVAAILVNSILMAATFWLFFKIKKLTSNRLGYFFFIVLWISMEYLHLNWDLSWPWLTLGNVFATYPFIIQWYEFTGFLGGSLWVILINLLLFYFYKNKRSKKLFLCILLIFIFPIVISSIMYFNFETNDDNYLDVLIIQPNVDPYSDKFVTNYESQLEDFIVLAKKGLSKETDLLIGPETALVEQIWEDDNNSYEKTHSIALFKELQKQYPNLNIIVGASTYRLFSPNEKKSSTARQIRDEVFYDIYNSAIYISNTGFVDIYHKTKLVPGVEKMPFPRLLDPLAKLAVNLGGISGSLGSINYINSFKVNHKIVSPLICYESIYGEMALGPTNLVAVITNDGWWKKTAGFKQHLHYSRLRAIEQRKSVIRSANTGISAVINARGDILKQSLWDEAVYLSEKVNTNNQVTFYSHFGDYIGRICSFISAIILIVTFVNQRLQV